VPGSVIAMAVTSVPFAQPGSQRFFCSSLPNVVEVGDDDVRVERDREARIVALGHLLHDHHRVEEVAALRRRTSLPIHGQRKPAAPAFCHASRSTEPSSRHLA
jgi:hypothetical protein